MQGFGTDCWGPFRLWLPLTEWDNVWKYFVSAKAENDCQILYYSDSNQSSFLHTDLGRLASASWLKRAQARKLSRDGKALLGIESPCISRNILSVLWKAHGQWCVKGGAARCTRTHFSLCRGCVSSKAVFVFRVTDTGRRFAFCVFPGRMERARCSWLAS